MGRWNPYSGSPIISGVWPNGSYSDCDISAIVGEHSVVAYLKITKTSGTTFRGAVRKKGDNDSVYDSTANAGHRGYHSTHDTSARSGIIAITNNEGIFQYTGNGESATAHLLGYFILTSSQIKHLFDTTLPTTWTNFDYDLISDKSLLFLKYKTLSNSDYIGLRPDLDSDNYLLDTVSLSGGGVSSFGDHNINELAEYGIIPSTTTKILYEHNSSNANGGPPEINADLIAYELNNYVPINQNILDTTTAKSWVEYNVASYIGNQEALLILKCKNYSGGSSAEFSIRPSNEVDSWSNTVADVAGIGCASTHITSNRASILIVPTYDKKIDISCSASSGSRKTVDIIGYIPFVPLNIDSIIPSYLSIRINFTNPMLKDSELTNINNYRIESALPESVGTNVISVIPENVDEPTYVDIECNDVTHGSRYILIITADKLQNIFGEFITSSNNTEDFYGVSEIPIIQSISAIASNKIQLIFSKEMEYYNIIDSTRYTFDKGLSVISVELISPGVVILTTTKQVPNEYYTLTIS